MAVKVLIRDTGESVTGKFVVLEKDTVGLFSGIMSDKKGGFRGCGKKHVFEADDPSTELKQR